MEHSSQDVVISEEEARRLQALYQYYILDTPAEEAFDRITELAASLCAAPAAFISLVDKDRQWFKSCVGSSLKETARDISFCQFTIKDTEVFEVEDATKDPRFSSSPLVTSEPYVRFYAGVPLCSPQGFAIGALCVTDSVPRRLSDEQKQALTALAQSVVAELELRKKNQELERANQELIRAHEQLSKFAVGQERTRQELSEAYGRFRRATEGSADGFWEHDFVTGKVWYSPRFEALLGYEPGEFPATFDAWSSRLHPDDLEKTMQAVEDYHRRGVPYDVEYRCRRKDGEYRWFRARAIGEPNENQVIPNLAFTRISGSIQDVHELKQQRATLTKYSERMSLLHTIATDTSEEFQLHLESGLEQIVTSLTMDGAVIVQYAPAEVVEENPEKQPVILHATPSFEELDQHTRTRLMHLLAQVQEKRPSQLVLPDLNCGRLCSSLSAEDAICICLEGEHPGQYLGVTLHLGSGQRGFVLFYSVRPVQEECNVTVLDFLKGAGRWLSQLFQQHAARTAIEAMNSELQRSNAELNDFVKVASHDLRSPLRAIRNLAEWTLADATTPLPEKVHSDLTLIKSRAERLDRLLVDLLEYARAGQLEAQVEELPLSEVATDVLRYLSIPSAFSVEIPALPTICSVRAAVEKVFRNIISNAICHHDKAFGKITFSGERLDNGRIRIEISDDGPGIASDDQERVFAMFTTLQAKDVAQGSGMGLSFVRKTMNALGGEVFITSNGRGTIFVLDFPRHFNVAGGG